MYHIMLHRYLIILFVCITLQSAGEHPYSRWNLSSFIAYVTQPRGDQNSRRHYMYTGGTIVGLGALSWIAWKLRPKKNPEVKKVIELKENELEVNLIINHLSIVSGIHNNNTCTDCTDIYKKTEDLARVKKGFEELIKGKDIPQQAMIDEVKGFFENQEIRQAIFKTRSESQTQGHEVTTRVKQESIIRTLSIPIHRTYDVEIGAHQGKIIHMRRTNLKYSTGQDAHFSQPLYQSDAFITLLNNVCESLSRN